MNIAEQDAIASIILGLTERIGIHENWQTIVAWELIDRMATYMATQWADYCDCGYETTGEHDNDCHWQFDAEAWKSKAKGEGECR